ncbi:kinase-like domain-containing protein [Suillus subluteus]|nr:kinase-like domain-containing protein [Suillus subluteus]
MRIDVADADSGPDLLKYVLGFSFAYDTLAQTMASQRLLADYHARKQLHHENLLTPLGFTYEFGLLPAIVYPWMHNGSLTTYLERHSTELTKEQKLRILRQVAAAINYLHSRGIVHGNLTANNILIDSDHNAHVEYDGILLWAAPKLYGESEDEKSLNPQPASDIYSFGCIMHQVMTGQPPYADVRSDHQDTVLEKPIRPSSPHDDADSFWDFIEKCWSDAGHRPSAVDVVSFLGSDHVTALVK